ncbi:MAG TPA: GTPase HflX [Nitrososphaerales archaeon]|nr:GTPase HflX [Nitrososphaerales archaeon]
MDSATVVTYPDEFAKKEIAELAEAAGYSVAELITQKRLIRSEFGVGSGKALELRDIVEQNHSKTLIVDEELTSSQVNNLSKAANVRVIDRDRLILDIFAKRANTAEAKLQVQLAELNYELPRLKDAVRNSKTGERAGFSGLGELAIDVKFRALKRQMVVVREKLAKVQASRGVQRSGRRRLGIPLVSLAGYTSSGKTTLFNRLAAEAKEVSPSLFTTLTTTTRTIELERSKNVLLSDTVGFVSRLPTYMVDSFKSTLEELSYADAVLLLIDASEDERSIEIKLSSCHAILDELKVEPDRVLWLLNKVDLVKGSLNRIEDDLLKGRQTLRISALRGDGLRKLKNALVARLSETTHTPPRS